jgi:RNA polymerase sigma factor (sigma-70 family)
MRFGRLTHLSDVNSVPSSAIEDVVEWGAGRTDAEMVTNLQIDIGPALYDFARHQGLSDEQAADAVQESLLRLWRALRRGMAIERPAAWAFRTVYHLAMADHRWRRQLARLLPRIAPLQMDYAGPEASDRLSVWAAVDHLPARQRQALYLHYAADLPFDQVAEILGISAGAARSHASRGMATLRADLAKEMNP